jgi:hypothetical protein
MTGEERNSKLFVADAIRQVFGINLPIYVPWGSGKDYEAEAYSGFKFLPGEIQQDIDLDTLNVPVSEFDTNVLGRVRLMGGEYNVYEQDGSLVKKRFGDYTLPYSCIVSFTRESNITKTEVLGSTGTVKELYGKGDWQITIRGIAFNRRDGKGVTAQEQIDVLSKWASVCDSIGVLGSVFSGKEIQNIVIEEFSIQPVVGKWDAIPFQINALSDEPIELYI